MSYTDSHTPWPLQFVSSQRSFSHAEPMKPSAHLHSPDLSSQCPRFEHSTLSEWAAFDASPLPHHALPLGQAFPEQSAYCQPKSHKHWSYLWHTPCPEHAFGQSATTMETNMLAMQKKKTKILGQRHNDGEKRVAWILAHAPSDGGWPATMADRETFNAPQ